jgi:hypothetical protein
MDFFKGRSLKTLNTLIIILFLLELLQIFSIFIGEPKGTTKYILIIIIFVLFVKLNYTFIRHLKLFLEKTHSKEEVFQKFGVVTITGVSNIFLFSVIYYIFGIEFVSETVKNNSYASLYFSIMTWTTISYGDFTPPQALWFVVALEALMGYLYMALLVGLFLSLAKIKVKEHEENDQDSHLISGKNQKNSPLIQEKCPTKCQE